MIYEKNEGKQTMILNKKTLLATSLISLAITSGALIAKEEDKAAVKAPEAVAAKVDDSVKAEDTVVATVNGDKIMKSTLDGYLALLNKSGKADPHTALDDLVATEVALQDAKKTDILSRADIKKKISDFQRNVLLTTWTKEKVASFDITDADLKSAYDERVGKLTSKEYNARHILLKKEDEAKAVIKEIAGGADFEKVAKEKSTGPSATNGGSLGWFKAQTMVPAFANAVKVMKKGDVSKEPVKTQFGFHVIKLEDSRDAKLPTIESLKPQLQRVLAQKKMLAYMDEQKKTADIKIMLPVEKKPEEKKEDAPASK